VSQTLLIFIAGDGEIEGWLLLADRSVAARGRGVERVPAIAETEESVKVALVVPGDEVTLHWLELPGGLAPAQAAAAARLMASEVSAQPLGDMHVAVGTEMEGGLRCVALVPGLRMAAWIAKLQALGLDPDMVVPEPLLLLPRGDAIVRYDRGGRPLYRGPTDAFSMEPELAELVLAGGAVEDVDDADFERGLAEAIERRPVDLRQGAFAKRRRWTTDWPSVRRLAMLAAAILLATLAIQAASILRYTFAADAIEEEARQVAASALPRGGRTSDAPAELERRLTDLRGGGIGYSAIAAAMFAAVRATPNAELSAVDFDRDGTLSVTVMADTPATIEALRQRVAESGFEADIGPLRSGGGRQSADLTVRAP
jgi:general secretion pathway protein L